MKTIRTFIIAAGAVALLGMTAPAMADANSTTPVASTPILSYAFVDVEMVMKKSTAAQSVTTELQSKQKEIKSEFEKKAQAIQTEGNSLMKQRSTMAKDEFEKKYNSLEDKTNQLDKAYTARRSAFDQVGKKSIDGIHDMIFTYVEQIAQERQLASVFTRDAVIIGAKNLDITDEVIDRMNKSGKKVAIDWSPVASSKGGSK